MNYRQCETSREIRLWIGQIIVPAGAFLLYIDHANPDLKRQFRNKGKMMATKCKNKFKKNDLRVL